MVLTIFPYDLNKWQLLLKDIELSPIFEVEKIEDSFPETKIFLREKEGLDEYIKDLLISYGDIITSTTGKGLVEKVSSLLNKRKLKIAVAESCTGGLVSHLLTGISGSSNYFYGGVIAYSNDVKIEILKVPAKIIKKYGAVHEITAEHMAKGVKKLLNTDIGLSTTGIAGPTGGSDEKPVGTICIGVCIKNKVIKKRYIVDIGDREKNKTFFAYLALNLLRNL